MEENKHIKPKTRELCYSAHHDRCIYQYYAYLLNEQNNKRVLKDGINSSAIAYRNNLGKNNIFFSKQAFDYIKKLKKCYIIVGDFKSFFDSINHKYLKKQLCSLLQEDKLPDDYYAIYKNITKYSKISIKELLKIKGYTNRIKDLKLFNNQDRIFSSKEFREATKQHKILLETNTKDFGIPQGSAISAAMANIYMLDFDKKIHEYVSQFDGLFMRYSDDFIVVLPMESEELFKTQYEQIKKYKDTIPNLELESHKTQIYSYIEGQLENCNERFVDEGVNTKNIIDYLGFSFDGKNVKIRDKTLSKYYRKMYAKIKTIKKYHGITRKGNKINYRVLYNKFSSHGKKNKDAKEENKKYQGTNFIDYVIKASKIYKNEQAISKVIKGHMSKIRKRLNKK